MASSFHVDDNHRPLAQPAGLRPTPSSTGIAQRTTSASVQEMALPTGNASSGGTAVYRLAATQSTYYAFGVAGQSGSFTGPNDMHLLPLNWIEYVTAKSGDASLYVLQVSAAGIFQVSALK